MEKNAKYWKDAKNCKKMLTFQNGHVRCDKALKNVSELNFI
jgi:hypothetical protein